MSLELFFFFDLQWLTASIISTFISTLLLPRSAGKETCKGPFGYDMTIFCLHMNVINVNWLSKVLFAIHTIQTQPIIVRNQCKLVATKRCARINNYTVKIILYVPSVRVRRDTNILIAPPFWILIGHASFLHRTTKTRVAQLQMECYWLIY